MTDATMGQHAHLRSWHDKLP